MFQQQTGYQIKTIAVGTGAALALGARGEADVLLVHAPSAELDWMAAGNGIDRRLVMHNDFVILGPTGDPAGIRGKGYKDALRAISEKSSFVSRGDESGTNILERQLWKNLGIDPTSQPWYIESGVGMGQTLTVSDQKQAYTISDRGTYLARKSGLGLTIVSEGEPALLNVYHVIVVNPDRYARANGNLAGAKAFADFIVSKTIQDFIGKFGVDKYGEPLFFPDAGKSEVEPGP
jgi:tungstate transport system substrate-binding protein